ncbi:MAG: hypothetical protein PHR35_14685 [Kiritimatiellae bacterium]|nr:hypothetical protein [Kiritimatiellia bacterium]
MAVEVVTLESALALGQVAVESAAQRNVALFSAPQLVEAVESRVEPSAELQSKLDLEEE